MKYIHLGSNSLLKSLHRWPLGKGGAAQHFNHRGDIGLRDGLATVGDES
jgi:hypothetical protein